MTAKDLKNALLQEAVQGRLVPQIASEGNARDLLEEIRKSHTDLQIPTESAGKKKGDLRSKSQIRVIKKEKPIPEITEDEIPFDIPESWCWCRQSDIANISTGMTPLKSESKFYENGNIPWITSSLTNNEYIENAESFITEYAVENTSLTLYPKNTLILAMYGQGKTRGQISELLIPATINQACAAIELFLDNEYLRKFIKLFHNWNYNNVRKEASGSAQPNLNLGKVQSTLIPLPPISEQKRIVAAIEKFMPFIEEYGKKETQLKAINEKIGTLTKKAILQEAVQGKLVPQIAAEGNAKDLLEEIKKEKAKVAGKASSTSFASKTRTKEFPPITDDEIPFDIPENWCWCRLSELCNLYTGDSINETEKKLKYTNIKEGWFYIGTKDVNFDQTINYDNGIKIPFEKENFRIAPKNTVLMCIEGGSAGRKIAFTNQDVCFGNKLCCFNSYKNEIEKFIFYFLQSTLFTDAFKDNINGIIGGVSINNLKGMLFPLPPLAEQKRIVDVIEKMLPLCEKLGE